LRLVAIRKFYEMNDVVLNWNFTTEEIQRLVTKADERMRVVILLLASTGIVLG
jgi:endonuclease V-like protein UPF0215 family